MNYPADVGSWLQESAREWQKIQLAVLGFVGLCGVLQGDAGSTRPLWLQDLSGIAALSGLVFALLAVTMVATVAFPLGASSSAAAARRLRLGIAITFVAVGLTALSALSMWWPKEESEHAQDPSHQINVTTNSGSACGTLLSSASGSLDLEVNGERVTVPLDRLVSIQPVHNC